MNTEIRKQIAEAKKMIEALTATINTLEALIIASEATPTTPVAVEIPPVVEVTPAVETETDAARKLRLSKFSATTKFDKASSRQVDAMRPIASAQGISISQAVKYMDAGFALRDGQITQDDYDFILKTF